jgi:hypothetical protein
MATVSLREFGRMRGVSGEAVRKAIASGRLVKSVVHDEKGRPKIDPAIAATEWAQSTHPTHGGKRAEAPAPEIEAPSTPPADDRGAGGGAAATFAQSRAIKEAYLARLAKLEYEEKSAVLVKADAVKKEAFRVARMVRDGLLNIPDRVSAELAADSDAFTIHRKLTLEIRKALEAALGADHDQ